MSRSKPYNFVSHWRITASSHEVARVMNDLSSWQNWWPGLEKMDVLNGGSGKRGTTVACVWRSKIGYRLSLEVTITRRSPEGEVFFRAHGDLNGTGSWHAVPVDDTVTDMIIIWNVRAAKAWMNVTRPLLEPVFIANHKVLMRDGEKGLNDFLRKERAGRSADS